jgi:hypothetical protein
MAADIQHAHQLLDQLGPGQLAAVVHLLETTISPDEDSDTLSNAERKAVAEADEWLKHNQPISHEEVLAEFGLTMALDALKRPNVSLPSLSVAGQCLEDLMGYEAKKTEHSGPKRANGAYWGYKCEAKKESNCIRREDAKREIRDDTLEAVAEEPKNQQVPRW